MAKMDVKKEEKTLSVSTAQATFSQVIKRVERGEVIYITKRGRLVAKITPAAKPPKRERKPGVWRGKIHIAPDFDEVDTDLAQLFYDSSLEPSSR